jgi:hypothetical protein
VDTSLGHVEPPPEAVADRPGLLEHLLEHEVLVTLLLDRCQLHVETLHPWRDAFVAQVLEDQLVGPDDGQLVVVDIHDLLGVFHDGRGI